MRAMVPLAVHRLAFDRNLPPSEAMARIRDARSTTTTIRGYQ
jgi:hypothetical protein